MPVVEIDGLGEVEFPDSWSQDQVKAAANHFYDKKVRLPKLQQRFAPEADTTESDLTTLEAHENADRLADTFQKPGFLGQLWHDVLTRPVADFTKAATIGKTIQMMAGRSGVIMGEDEWPMWQSAMSSRVNDLVFPNGLTPGSFVRHESFTDPLNPNRPAVQRKLRDYYDMFIKDTPRQTIAMSDKEVMDMLNGIPAAPAPQQMTSGDPVIGAIGGAVEGVENFVLSTIGFLSSPVGLLTLGTVPAISKAAERGSRAARSAKASISLGFAALMGKELPAQWDQMRQAIKEGDTPKATKIGTEGFLTLVASGVAGAHGLVEGVKAIKGSKPAAAPTAAATTSTPIPRDEVPLAPLEPEGLPVEGRRVSVQTPPGGPILGQIGLALRESAIMEQKAREAKKEANNVPAPEKRASRVDEIPVVGQRPLTIVQNLILPERFMEAEANRDNLIAERDRLSNAFSVAARNGDLRAMSDSARAIEEINVQLNENRNVRESLGVDLEGELEGDYPPTAEQLGTFQSRGTVPELSDVTKSPDPSKLGAADQSESTRLRAGRSVQPVEGQVYPEPPVGVVPPESLRSEFVPEADVPEYPPKRPPAGAPEGEQRSGIISGTDLEKWADKVLGEDPRSKVRMGDPLDVRRVAAAAVKGAALLERGIRDFAAWSAEMIKQHGPWIEKSLPDLFKKSNKYLEVKQAQQAQDKSADPDSFVPPVQAKSELVTEFTDPTKAEKKKSSRMPYGDRMNTAMDAVSAPENKGKYIPAIQTADGEIITASDHSQAWEKMRKEGKKPAASKVMGYVDHDGKFLTLKDIAALESKEPVETAKAGEGETAPATEPVAGVPESPTTPATKEGGGTGETQTQTQGQEVLGKKPLRPLGEIYSEPFAERIRRLGGVVADKVAKDTQGIIDNAKRLYGELSADWLDKAKIASGKAFRGGTTWMNGIDNIKNSAGVVNAKASVSRLFTALETFNKTGNWDHVPPAARPLAKMLYDANLAMGRLANQGNPIGAVDSVKRLVTPWGTDVLKRGGGRAWEALVNGHAEANNKTVAFTENFFRRWKAELDKPTPDSTALDKISKEYVASFPNAVTHLKPILGWHEFLQSSPFHYLEQSGQRIANTVAFQQVYPPGSGKLNQTRTAIQAEVKTDAGMKEFDDMTRALRGYPTDVWWTIAPDTITGAASRAIGMALRPIKSLLLTQSLATNTGETLSGGAAIFFGYGRAFKAMYVSKQLRQQMIRTGQINKAIRDFSFSPSQPLQSLSKIGANLISRTFLNDFANEVQEFASARAAKMVADEIRTGTLPASDVPLIENTLRMMGFTKEQSKAAVAGNAPDVINQFETKAAEALSSGNQILAEKSRLGSSRTFNVLFWFHNYPMLKFRQGRSILNNVIEDARSGDWKGARSNAKLMGRFLGGTALSGAITAGVLAMVKEGLYGVGIRKQEAQDDFGRFVMDSFLMGMGGPLMAWSKIFEETGSVGQFTKDLPERVFDSVTPYSMAKNLGNAVTGSKEYEGLDSFEKIGKFLETKTPGLRPFKAGLAAVSLIQDNPKLDASIGAYYRWSHRNIGSNKTEIRKFNDDRKEVRHFAERVAKNIQDGKPFTDDLIKEIVAASKTKTDNPYDSAADSIRGKQILGMSISDDGKIHGKLSAEELGALRKHIGDDPVNRIMAYDTMLDQVADLVAGMKVKE